MSDAPALNAMASTGARQLDDIAAVIGRDAALKLSFAFRGLRITILKSYDDLHPLVRATGRDAADLLASHYHGTQVTIPATPGLKAEVYRLADGGVLTRTEIAAQLYVSERQVYRWLRARDEARSQRNQADLFAA